MPMSTNDLTTNDLASARAPTMSRRVFAQACLLPAAEALPTMALAQPRPDMHDRAAAQDIVDAARTQVGKTLHYDPAYVRIGFPLGDVPIDRGVCTDVIVRALRRARGLDLQQAIYEDVARDPRAYPRVPSGAEGPKRDPHIDHRRVPNQAAYFRRRGWALGTREGQAKPMPGDIVRWDLGGYVDHIGIVTDRRSLRGRSLVIHNIGQGALEEDVLLRWAVTGWFRVKAS